MHIMHTHSDQPLLRQSPCILLEVWRQYISLYFTIISSQVILLKEPSGPQWYLKVQVFYCLNINN